MPANPKVKWNILIASIARTPDEPPNIEAETLCCCGRGKYDDEQPGMLLTAGQRQKTSFFVLKTHDMYV